jgi:hypothetical protein
MADQAEVTKVVTHIATGQVSDSAAVSKAVMYLVLIPDDSGPDTSNKQGHVQSQLIRR